MYNYVESPYNYGANHNLHYPKFYEDLMVRKWERVISEENVDEEECKERQINQSKMIALNNGD
jgi:hypothetical protein